MLGKLGIARASEGVILRAAPDVGLLAPPPTESLRIPPRRDVVSSHLFNILSVVIDLVAVGVGYRLATDLARPSNFGELPAPSGIWLSIPLWLVVFAVYGLYDRPRLLAPSEEARRIFHAVTVTATGVLMVTFLTKMPVTRTWAALLWMSCLVCVSLGRISMRRLRVVINARGRLIRRVLIVGTNDEALGIGRALARQTAMGHLPVGYVDIDGESMSDTQDIPVVGSLADLADAVHTTEADVVILASTALAQGRLPALCASLHELGVEINISAGLPHIAASRVTVKPLDGLAMLSVRANQLSSHQKALKRAIDVCLSAFGLLVGAPFLILVGLCVRLTSSGPAIFRQVRVGEGGKQFVIYKFRTMVGNAETLRIELEDRNEADGPLFKVQGDPRVTRVGRALRHFGFDELPQLYNVLKGEMSLVGPRPPLPSETERYDEWARGRLRVKPGITGLWQVNGRHELSFADYVRYDLFYVENWSVIMDIFTMMRTVGVVLTRRGAS